MFEKEAEKYISNLDECRTKNLMRDAFKDGAEFGYNKAFVEADKNLKAIVADFNKAKEIIKEMLGMLPKENIEGVYEITEEAEQFIREVAE